MSSSPGKARGRIPSWKQAANKKTPHLFNVARGVSPEVEGKNGGWEPVSPTLRRPLGQSGGLSPGGKAAVNKILREGRKGAILSKS